MRFNIEPSEYKRILVAMLCFSGFMSLGVVFDQMNAATIDLLLFSLICSLFVRFKIQAAIVLGILFFLNIRPSSLLEDEWFKHFFPTFFSVIGILILHLGLRFIPIRKIRIALLVLFLSAINFIFPHENVFLGNLNLAAWSICYSIITDGRILNLSSIFKIGINFNLGYPFAKGFAYLKQTQVRNTSEKIDAIAHGSTLLVWSILFSWIYQNLSQYSLVPSFAEILNAPKNFSLYVRWISLIKDFSQEALSTFAVGHAFVGYMRISGFQIAKNSDWPFLATRLGDFFNRYNYYFKEFLNDLFFMPSFFIFGRLNLQLRLIVSTFIAAGVGNYAFHISNWNLNLVDAKTVFNPSFATYCFLLSVGLSLSFLSSKSIKKSKEYLPISILKIVRVSLFFTVLHIFYFHSPHSLEERLYFLVSLIKN